MITIRLDTEMLDRLLSIERSRTQFGSLRIPIRLSDRLRKSSKKKSSYASNKIEGNPLTEQEAADAIDSSKRHFLKPEQEVRNYYGALEFLDQARKEGKPFSRELMMDVQARIVRGESREKIGLRGAMPPGVLFAVYDDATGVPEYIPPSFDEVPALLDELVRYVETSQDHPILKAAVVHYQLVTIHPFEDGNGRTARLLSDYVLELFGFGFNGIGSLEEYFAYDIDEYYRSLQMGLPVLYYEGRENPPHPEIWIHYFLRMVELHASKVLELANSSLEEREKASLSFLTEKEREFLGYLRKHGIRTFTPIDMAAKMGVTNRTIINWSANLAKNGFLVPDLTGQRIRSYTRPE